MIQSLSPENICAKGLNRDADKTFITDAQCAGRLGRKCEGFLDTLQFPTSSAEALRT